jgi:hypothetical protein
MYQRLANRPKPNALAARVQSTLSEETIPAPIVRERNGANELSNHIAAGFSGPD